MKQLDVSLEALVIGTSDGAQAVVRVAKEANLQVAYVPNVSDWTEFRNQNRFGLILIDQDIFNSASESISNLVRDFGGDLLPILIRIDSTGSTHLGDSETRLLYWPQSDQQIFQLIQSWIREVDLSFKLRASIESISALESESRQLFKEVSNAKRRLEESQAVAKIGCWETDLTTFDVSWTAETFRIFELDPETFTPTHEGFLAHVHPDDRERADLALQNTAGVPGTYSIEHRIVLPDGRVKFVEERWRTFCDQDGKPFRAFGTCQDITEKTQALITVSQSEERFRSLYDNAPDAIYLIELDGSFADINAIAEEFIGRPRDEIVGKSLWDLALLKDSDIQLAEEAFTLSLRGNPTGPDEYHLHRPDGSTLPVEIRTYPVVIEGKNRVMGIARDISSRLMAEKALSESERVLREIILHMPIGLVSHAPDTSVQFANPTAAELLGLTQFQMQGKTANDPIWSFLNDDGTPMKLEDFPVNRALAAPTGLSTGIVTGICRSDRDQVTWVQCNSHTMLDSEGKVQQIIVTFADITELRSAQSKAETMNLLLNEAQRVANLGSWEIDLVQNHLVWSEETCRLFGVIPSEFGGTFEAFEQFIYPADRGAYDAQHEGISPQQPYFEAEYRIQRTDGKVRWMFERGLTFFDSNGDQIRQLGVVLDVSDRRNSEEERKRLFDLSPDLLSIAGFDGLLKQANPAWTECLGWTNEELTSRPMVDFIVPEDIERTLQSRAFIQAGNQGRVFENRYLCKDGSYRWLSWNVQPLPESEEVFAVARDVTDRHRSESQLMLLETCISRINDIVLITEAKPIDGDGPKIIYVNDAFVKRTGFTREEAIGKTPRILQGPKTQRESLDRIRTALQSWTPVREELINYTKAGEEFWIEIEIVPIADPSGWFTHWVAIERDITERQKSTESLKLALDATEKVVDERTKDLQIANEELKVAVAEADAANLAKSEFLSRMSHELRTPLNAILGYSQLLDLQYSDPKIREASDWIKRGGNHLLQLINEVLDLSRIESDKLTMSIEPIEFGGVLTQAIELVEPLAHLAPVSIQWNKSECSGIFVSADQQRLLQVLINVLSNGIKFNRSGGEVTVRCSEKSEGIFSVQIADTGTGIAKEDQNKLFQPFQRLGQKNIEGTGLGLALSSKFMALMGGKLALAHSSPEGTTFEIQLQLATRTEIESIAHEGLIPQEKLLQELSGSVLYIEDNTSNMRLLEAVFSSIKDVELIPAVQGSMGLDLARHHLPNLILLDVHLPDMMGHEVLKRLKSDPLTASIPVLALSADATERQAREMKMSGAVAYLTKPINMKLLFELMEQFLPRKN